MIELNDYIDDGSVNNFADILDYYVAKNPQKFFLIEPSIGKKFTYEEFNQLVSKTAAFLFENGVKNGDILSIVIENSWTYLCFYFASIKLGVVVNPFPVSLEIQDLKRYIDHVQPKLVATSSHLFKKLSKSGFAYPLLEVDGYDWLETLNNQALEIEFPKIDIDLPSCLYYSSGTTTSPKSVLVSHRNMLRNIGSIVEGFRFDENENHLIFLPLGHTASINYSMLPCLFVGGTITLVESIWKIRNSFWELISKYGVTYLEMVPTSLFIILNMPKPRPDLNMSSLKWIGCGSSQLLTAYQYEFDAKFGIKVGNLYGLSETGPTHIDYPLDNNWTPGSIGYALSVNECKILDDNDNICGVGVSGEIVIKGDNVFIDYYKNTDLYLESVKNGYFYTGDIGYLGSDGKFYFSGRKKDLIIKGGVNILPAEIEEILIDHPNIGEVAVFGIPDQFVGEEICAAIQLKKDTNQKEILDFCSKQLSQYKLPKEIIIIDELPKGPSGKILKRVLRENYVKKIGNNKHVG